MRLASGSPEPILFVTSNSGKAREASFFLGRSIEAHPLELVEIQSLDFDEVVRSKAADAARRLGKRVLVEDSGLQLAAWNGYPGPLTKWVTQSVGQEGLARMLDPFADRRARAVSALALAEPGQEPDAVLVAIGQVEGTLASEPRGAHGFGWDVLFVPEGDERTFAEMDEEEKNRRSHRMRAFAALAALLD